MRPLHLVLCLAFPLALACVPASAQTLPALRTFASTAVAQHSGRCMELPGAVATLDIQLVQNTCNGRPEQGFRFEPVSGVVQGVKLRTSTNACVGPRAAATANGTALVQQACSAGAEQNFRLEAINASTTYRLRHMSSGRCMEISGSSQQAGGRVQLWDCQSPTSGRNQNWGMGGASAGGFTTSLPVPANQAEASRFLQQATYGATPAEIQRVVSLGYAGWIDNQFTRPATLHLAVHTAMQNELMPHYTDASDRTCTFSWGCNLSRHDAWMQIAVTGEDQLRQRVAFALSQLFVISDVSDNVGYSHLAVSDYYDTLAVNAFGNYRTLLEEVTLHPLMGRYLGMLQNEKANASQNTEPDENFAREVMQLFSIGLVELNTNGTPRLDPAGNPIPTYNNAVITNMARALTGWNFGGATSWWAWEDTVKLPGLIQSMTPWANYHDTGAKTLLNGASVPAGGTAQADLKAALDNLANHPNVGPFVARHLIQRLVTSNPSPAYIQRVATVFNNNGSGVRGDLRAVVRAILLDTEARDMTIAARDDFGKVKEPMLRQTAIWRAFPTEGQAVATPAGATTRAFLRNRGAGPEMGQTVMSSPSVFNFYRPNYQPPGEMRRRGLYAPELQILNEASAMSTYNHWHGRLFQMDRDDTSLAATVSDPRFYTARMRLNLSVEKGLAVSPGALADRLNLLLMAGRMTPAMRQILVDAAYATPLNDGGGDRVEDMIFLIASSSQFAAQR
ncbi:DUF1800 family protein [Arenimonas sp. MALMAid1274]|uniref:DUF1800 family protein n=1 Tax=Arenimonas sp. MALMAid1274 TaxID=3411630 RepID=UPI003BA396B0